MVVELHELEILLSKKRQDYTQMLITNKEDSKFKSIQAKIETVDELSRYFKTIFEKRRSSL